MYKKLEEMTEQEFSNEIDSLAQSCWEIETCDYESNDDYFDKRLILFRLKRRLVTLVYYVKQKGNKKSLDSIDYAGDLWPKLAREYLEEIIFVDHSLRDYNLLVKCGKHRAALKIIDTLKEIGLMN